MLLFADTGDQSLSPYDRHMDRLIGHQMGQYTTRQRSAEQSFAEPVGAPSAIPPIIITPFNYHTPLPAIDPRWMPPGPPLTWPAQPAMHMC